LAAFGYAPYPPPPVGVIGSLFGLAPPRMAVSTVPPASSAGYLGACRQAPSREPLSRFIVIPQVDVSFAAFSPVSAPEPSLSACASRRSGPTMVDGISSALYWSAVSRPLARRLLILMENT